MTEKQFAYLSPDGIKAILDANRNQGHTQYEMSLNHADFEMVIRALEFTYRNAMFMDSRNYQLSDEAGEIISSIAQTYEIEFI